MNMKEFIEKCVEVGQFDFATLEWPEQANYIGGNQYKDLLESAIESISRTEKLRLGFMFGDTVFGVDDNEFESIGQLQCFRIVDPEDYEVPQRVSQDFSKPFTLKKPMF